MFGPSIEERLDNLKSAVYRSVSDRLKALDRTIDQVMADSQRRIEKLESMTTGRPNRETTIDFYRSLIGDYGLGSTYSKGPEYSLQEQLDHIREHIGLKYQTTPKETKLVSIKPAKKPAKKVVKKKPATKAKKA